MSKKKWFQRSFCGGIEGVEVRRKALRRACSFLNQNDLSREDVLITEGMTVPGDNTSMQEGAIYEVTVFYLSENKLPYEDIPEDIVRYS